ncbi:MAG: hypothetical protein WC661_09425 [Opitutaceae bacterium]|jgi:hypothetical protein
MPKAIKIFRRLSLGILFVGLIVAVGLFIVTRDEPPPDINDLQPRPRTLPDSENALASLRAIASEHARQTKENTAYTDAIARLLESYETWDTADATLVVNQDKEVWPRFDAAIRLPSSETKLPWVPDDFIAIGPLRELWRGAMIRARLTSFSGQPDVGFEQVLTTLPAATRISDSGGVLIEYLTGVSLRSITISTLRTITVQTPPSDESLRHSLALLAANRPSVPALIETFKAEYSYAGQAAKEFKKSMQQWRQLGEAPPPLKTEWFYKPNQTLRLFADKIRQIFPLIDRPLDALSPLDAPTPSPALFANLPNPDNSLGRYFIAASSFAYEGVLLARLRDQTSISLTQVWLAVILYEREHGDIPESLETLVPSYLPAMPRDYFDGAPIRYSRAYRAVWSVGKNHFTVVSADPKVEPSDLYLKLPSDSRTPVPPRTVEH